jgi:hypothetical protein
MTARVMKTRTGSTCPACQAPVRVGQRITQHDGQWIHLDCHPVVAALPPERPCPTCSRLHEICEFTSGSVYCTRPDCANPHHRRADL